MGIILYNEPMDKRLEDKAFFEFFRKRFEEEHKNDPPVMDDDSWDLAVRNTEYVDRIYAAYKAKNVKTVDDEELTPRNYDRWNGRIGIKVISTPSDKKEGEKSL